MIIACRFCLEMISCTNRSIPTICEDCIEREFENETGQPCQAKMDNEFPELIICPVCQTINTLSSHEFGYR